MHEPFTTKTLMQQWHSCQSTCGSSQAVNAAAVKLVPRLLLLLSALLMFLLQLTRCISSLACYRSDQAVQDMAKWALLAADTPTALLTASDINTYMAGMCTHGYTGPICGACQAGFGHSGHACVKCPPRSVNSFIYFLVCCFMLLVPALQMVLHSKGVSKSAQPVAAARRAPRPAAPDPALLPKAGACAAGGSAAFLPVLQPVYEVAPNSAPFVCPSASAAAEAGPAHVSPFAAEAAAGGAGGGVGSSIIMIKDAHAIELAHMQHPAVPVYGSGSGGGWSDVQHFRADQGGVSGFAGMLPQFCQPTAAVGAIDGSQDGSAASTAATILSGLQPSQVGFGRGGGSCVPHGRGMLSQSKRMTLGGNAETGEAI